MISRGRIKASVKRVALLLLLGTISLSHASAQVSVTVSPGTAYVPFNGTQTFYASANSGFSAIQIASFTTGSASGATTLALSNNSASGDLLYGGCAGNGSTSGGAVTFSFVDTGLNSWTYPTSSTNTNQEQTGGYTQFFGWTHATSALVAGTDTITINFGVSGAWACGIYAIHGGGYTTLDQVCSGIGASGTTQTSCSITTTTADTIDIMQAFDGISTNFSSHGTNMTTTANTLLSVTVQSPVVFVTQGLVLTNIATGTDVWHMVSSDQSAMMHFDFK